MKNKGPIPIRPGVRTRTSANFQAPPVDEHLSFLGGLVGAAVVTLDAKTLTVTDANEAFLKLLGYNAEEATRLSLADFAEAFPGAIDGDMKAVVHEYGRFTFDCNWLTSAGRKVRVRCSTADVTKPDRATQRVIVAEDLTDELRGNALADFVRSHDLPLLGGALWVDHHGRIDSISDNASLLLGCSGEALIGRPIGELDPIFSDASWQALRAQAEATGFTRLEISLRRHDDTALPVVVDICRVDIAGERSLCLYLRDKAPALKAGRDTGLSERYALAALGANDGLWDWNLATGDVFYSERWRAILGLDGRVVPPVIHSWLDRIDPEQRRQVDIELRAHLDGASEHFESEHRVRHSSGGYRWVLVRGIAVRDDRGQPLRMAGSQTDITQRKAAEARLRFEALHDPLTGLANRSLLIKRLHESLERARCNPDQFLAVVFLDVDRFKIINDSLGHNMGDMLLRAIGARLKRCVRAVDTVARLGGDEFVLLLDNIGGTSDALRVADRVQEEIGIPYNLRGYEVFSSVSLGVAFSSPDYHDAEELLRDADIAMYRAKQQGANRRTIFNASMRQAAVQRLTVETDLRKAVERGEFTLYYQPFVNLATGRIKGFEALVRWNHPKRGMVDPGSFIPLAEETGIIVPIGRWALQAACKQALEWDAHVGGGAKLSVSVNVSGRQLALPLLVDQVDEILTTTGLDPARLNLEITESVLMENAHAARATLMGLRKLGVRLHIDDFGTGYSSLAYLHRFPIDTLKIDRSFLLNHDGDEDPWAIVETIRSLAHHLGMTVTAEGVESLASIAKLRELGVDMAQGYQFARPVPAEQVVTLLSTAFDTDAG